MPTRANDEFLRSLSGPFKIAMGILAVAIIAAALVSMYGNLARTEKRIRLDPDSLSNVFINGIPAQDVARGGDPKFLEGSDIEMSYGLTGAQDAERIISFLSDEMKKRGESESQIKIIFSYLPAAVAAKCADGSLAARGFPQKSCLAIKSFGPHSLPRGNWSQENYDKLLAWLDELSLYNPKAIVFLGDCDNTMWAGDVEDAVFETAVKAGIVSWDNVAPLQNYPKTDGMTVWGYYNFLYDDKINSGPLVAYNFAAQAVANLPLIKIKEAFDKTKEAGLLPKPYREMIDLVNHLQDMGVGVGFVSGSPFTVVALMLEEGGFLRKDKPGGSISYVEGIGNYVKTGEEMQGQAELITNLARASDLKTSDELFVKYGDLIVTPRVDEVITARKGKGAAGEAIIVRHAAANNMQVGSIRLAGFAGDNIAPFNDMAGASPIQTGNDQGMVRAHMLIDAPLFLNIYRGVRIDGGKLDLDKKSGNEKNFRAFVKQSETIYPGAIVVDQIGIEKCSLDDEKTCDAGKFVPETVPAISQ